MDSRRRGVTVKLSEGEMRRAAHVGVERRLRAIERGRRNRHKWDGSGNWEVDIHAAASELAVALLIGREWEDTPEPDYAGDVGEGVQVRWTPRRDGRLILHPDDVDGHAFILVRGQIEALEVTGWMYARDGKQSEFWCSDIRSPAFLVPDRMLRSVPDRRTPQPQSA